MALGGKRKPHINQRAFPVALRANEHSVEPYRIS